MRLFTIIMKNLKLLIRAKSSALIIILAPLIIILLLGMAYDNANVFSISIGLHFQEKNAEIQSFIDKIDNQNFELKEYDNKQRCIEDIQFSVINTCLAFPSNFSMEGNNQQELQLYVDDSKINLVWMITNMLSQNIRSRGTEVSKDITGVLLDKIDHTKSEIAGVSIPKTEDTKLSLDQSIKDAESIKNKLSLLDLNYNENNLPISKALSTLTSVRNELTLALNTASTSSKDAKSDVNSLSEISEETKDEITDLIGDAISGINDAKNLISSNNDGNLHQLGTYLNSIYNELNDVQANLNSAQTTRLGVSGQLDSIRTRISKNIEELEIVEDTLSNVLIDLNSFTLTNVEKISMPVKTDVIPITSKSTYLNYLFPSLIILMVMFIAILLGTTLVMMEKHSQAFLRNFISPTSNITFVVGIFLTVMLLIVIQLGIMIGIASYFFSVQDIINKWTAPLVILVSATFFTLLGMTIGYLFSSEETGTLAAVSTGSILLFLSNTIIPLESIPPGIRKYVMFNPFVISEQLLRESLLFSAEIMNILKDISILLGASIILFIFISMNHNFETKQIFKKMAYWHNKRRRVKVDKVEGSKVKTKSKDKKTKIIKTLNKQLAHIKKKKKNKK